MASFKEMRMRNSQFSGYCQYLRGMGHVEENPVTVSFEDGNLN